jgi:hypothetical protein
MNLEVRSRCEGELLSLGFWPVRHFSWQPGLLHSLAHGLGRKSLFPDPLNAVTALLVSYLVAAVGLGIGWVKGFPRWSYPYAAFAFVFALYWMGIATPGVKILNHTFQRNELWGWRAWVPLLTVMAVVFVMTRTLEPVRCMARDVRQDWTRLSFAVYGIMPFAVRLFFDEVRNTYEFPFTLMANVILVVGAFSYLRSKETKPRVLSLLMGTSVMISVAALGNGIYWHGRQESWMATPANGYREALGVAMMGVVLLILMFSPALLRFRTSRKELMIG